MRRLHLAVAIALGTLSLGRVAGADLGWSERQYEEAYGAGQRGYGRANERAYRIGDNHLVVEFAPDGSASLGELWVLAVMRDSVPAAVLAAGAKAEAGPTVETVVFKTRSAIPAEIRETVIDGVVVRADIRNHLLSRVAFCGPEPTCSLWRRIFGPPCEKTIPCPVLDRALQTDRTMDQFHERMERAAGQGSSH